MRESGTRGTGEGQQLMPGPFPPGKFSHRCPCAQNVAGTGAPKGHVAKPGHTCVLKGPADF